MMIDFRVRAPFEAYRQCNLFTSLDMVEKDTLARVDAHSPASAREFSMTLLLSEAEDAGFDKLVIPVRQAPGADNSQLAELLTQYPDRLVGLCGVNVANMDKALCEIKKYVLNGPCKGITLEPGQDPVPWHVNATRMHRLYEFCQQNNVPIAMTFGGIMTSSLRFYNPLELDDIAGAFPKLKICLCHGGWPYVTECCQIALNRGNVWLAPDLYMVRSPGMNDYFIAANHLLRERIIFASAYPILPLREARDACLCHLSDESRSYVMGGNAAAFLGIKD